MKKISLILLALVIFQFVNGQTNVFPTTGNIGIGTVAPLRLLEVNLGSNLATFGGRLPIGNFSGIEFGYFEPTNLSYRKSALVFERLDGAARGKIHILNNGGENSLSATLNDARLTINYDGNVGIGTVNPSAKLHINAPLNDAAIKIGAPNTPGNLNVPIGASTGGYNIDFYTWRDVQPDQIGARIRAERWNTHSNNNALIQSMDLAFYTSIGLDQTNLTEKMRISSIGNVSIGTNDAKGYKLAVNGKIRAQELKIEIANWPDYVFSKGYNLPNLLTVEKHINKEGHLPDMPSAKEVEQNGINVSEMNAKLLKKIEELTLYVIELNKKSSSQEEKVENLQKEVRMLKLKK